MRTPNIYAYQTARLYAKTADYLGMELDVRLKLERTHKIEKSISEHRKFYWLLVRDSELSNTKQINDTNKY